MKLNDIFTQQLDHRHIRFQLTELTPWVISVQTTDLGTTLCESACLPHYPNFNMHYAIRKGDIEYITNERGDEEVKKLTKRLFLRIRARHQALMALSVNDEDDSRKAKRIVDKLDKELKYYEVKYLPAIADCIQEGGIDPQNETDITMVKEIIEYIGLLPNGLRDEIKLFQKTISILSLLKQNAQHDDYKRL